jgi:hypothetical protein
MSPLPLACHLPPPLRLSQCTSTLFRRDAIIIEPCPHVPQIPSQATMAQQHHQHQQQSALELPQMTGTPISMLKKLPLALSILQVFISSNGNLCPLSSFDIHLNRTSDFSSATPNSLMPPATNCQTILARSASSGHLMFHWVRPRLSCWVPGNGLIEEFKDETPRKKKQLNKAEIALWRKETAHNAANESTSLRRNYFSQLTFKTWAPGGNMGCTSLQGGKAHCAPLHTLS